MNVVNSLAICQHPLAFLAMILHVPSFLESYAGIPRNKNVCSGKVASEESSIPDSWQQHGGEAPQALRHLPRPQQDDQQAVHG